MLLNVIKLIHVRKLTCITADLRMHDFYYFFMWSNFKIVFNSIAKIVMFLVRIKNRCLFTFEVNLNFPKC